MLDNLREPSAAAITILVSVLFILIGIPIYYFEGFSYLPAYIALFIGIFSVVYTRENALMSVKIKHSDDLHVFLEFWMNQITDLHSKIQRSVGGLIKLNVPYNSVDQDKLDLETITGNILYDDFVNNHLGNAPIDLKKEYLDYLSMLEKYRNTAKELFKLLSEKSKKLFDSRDISIETADNFTYNGENLVFPYFYDLIFLYLNNGDFNLSNPQYVKTSYVKNDGTSIEGYPITITFVDKELRPTIGIVKDDRTAKELIDVFNRLKSKDLETSKVIDDLNRISGEIERLFEIISNCIEELLKYPIFGEKCLFIRKAL